MLGAEYSPPTRSVVKIQLKITRKYIHIYPEAHIYIWQGYIYLRANDGGYTEVPSVTLRLYNN